MKTPIAILLLVACASTPQRSTPPPAPGSFVIRDVRVFDGSKAIDHVDVVVRAGRIASVGRDADAPGLPVIDGAGRTVVPGLIDAHVHIRRESALRDALRFGVTTLLDMFSPVEVMQAHNKQRDSLGETALADLYSAGAPVTSPGGMGTQFGIAFETIERAADAPAFIRARVAEGSDYIKILYEPDAGFVTTISAETLAAVIAATHAERRLAVVHVSSLAGARAAVAAGADGLAHAFGDAVVDDELASRMAARGVFLTATLSAFAYLDSARSVDLRAELAADPHLAPFLTDAQKEKLAQPLPTDDNPMRAYFARFQFANAAQTVRRLRTAGVKILAGDDAANFGPYGVSLLGELELLTRAGLSPAEALEAATRAPADAFRLADRGRITPGARADLVLVDGNPLVDIRAMRAIVRVFKNGFEIPRAAGGTRTRNLRGHYSRSSTN